MAEKTETTETAKRGRKPAEGTRVSVRVSTETAKRIANFRWDNRYERESDALAAVIAAGLDSLGA